MIAISQLCRLLESETRCSGRLHGIYHTICSKDFEDKLFRYWILVEACLQLLAGTDGEELGNAMATESEVSEY